MRLFIPITKIDEEKREVYGTLTQEVPDRDDEVFDYVTSKPFFEQWSQYFQDATAGKSMGNLRAMHLNVAAGRLTAMVFDDDRLAIDIGAKVVDEAEWQKCLEGVYTGFSAAGHVVKRWRDPNNRALMRYTADPYEASLADFPCVPTATFKYMKIGGASEDRTFKKTGAVEYADEAGRRFSLATKSHVRHALAVWGQPGIRAKYDDAAKTVIGRRIREAARTHDIAVSEKTLLRGDYAKGLYDVGRLAAFVQELGWLQQNARSEADYELDNSPVPDKLLIAIKGLADVLEEMTGEECRELLAQLGMEEEFATSTTTKATQGSGTMANNDDKATDASDREFRQRLAKALIAMDADGEGTGSVAKVAATAATTLAAAAAPAKVETPAAGAAAAGTEDDRFAKLSSRVDTLATELATVRAERDELKKNVEDLADAGKQMAEQLVGRPGVLKAVGRTDDVDTPASTEAAKVADAEPKTARDAFKKSFRNPQIVTGVPGGEGRPAAAR